MRFKLSRVSGAIPPHKDAFPIKRDDYWLHYNPYSCAEDCTCNACTEWYIDIYGIDHLVEFIKNLDIPYSEGKVIIEDDKSSNYMRIRIYDDYDE